MMDLTPIEHFSAKFTSPSQRRWFFATHPEKVVKPSKPKKENRWPEIAELVRTFILENRDITPSELVNAVGNSVDPKLTKEEENRIHSLVSPEKARVYVAPVEEVPIRERTPEIEEILEKEKTRIDEEKEREREEMEESKLRIPRVKPPGIVPIKKIQSAKNHDRTEKEYFKEEHPELCDADHCRAFQQSVILLRSTWSPKEVKEEITETYPEVDVTKIVSAAEGFLKTGAKDAYVCGRLEAHNSVSLSDKELLVKLAELEWKSFDKRYLKGFRDGLPPSILAIEERKEWEVNPW